MLRQWLGPVPLQTFTRQMLGQTPHAAPGAAQAVVPLLDWNVLERLLAADPRPDVLVAQGGQRLDVPAPRSLAALRRLMAHGLGVVVRQAERQDPDLQRLARSFERDVPGEVHVQLYATPAGTQTFGWHFDAEEVFIAQTLGAKTYYFRRNTVSPDIGTRQPDFTRVRDETSPLMSSCLVPGDWLYIPATWWHLVRAIDDTLSISIGVMRPGTAPPGFAWPASP
jgi:hypothetical protein